MNRPYQLQRLVASLSVATLLAAASIAPTATFSTARAAETNEIDQNSKAALESLYASNPSAKAISEKARAVLVFPSIVKAGLVFGAAYGEGEMRMGSQVVGYYNSFTGSWGLQAGAQSYGYAVFLMTDEAVEYVRDTAGWEIGVGPTVVVVNEGVAKNLSTSTLKEDAYAFIFDQQGLMAGVSIEGTKITKIHE
ncbi:MAG: twin-arginine translocation pathway signal protein [Alphaproteobacteria bacterium]|nr:twin-arginine translocation pathway signal protein [Alphaproteobacteria bacterium]